MGIISKFDWDDAAKMFVTMGWTHQGKTPSPEDLQNVANRLAWKLSSDGCGSTLYSTGHIAIAVTGSQVNVFVGMDAFVSKPEFIAMHMEA